MTFYLRSDNSGIGWNARLAKLLLAVATLMLLLTLVLIMCILMLILTQMQISTLQSLAFPARPLELSPGP